MLSARRGLNSISMDAMEESIERVIAGPEKKSRVISDYEKKLVSYHEGGHALVAYLLPHTDPFTRCPLYPGVEQGLYTPAA